MSIAEDRRRQGVHPDPIDPRTPLPDQTTWSARQRSAYAGAAMDHYRSALRLSARSDTRAGVLDDLSTYYGLSPEECVRRCLNWEQWSVEEWQSRSRKTAEDIADFYHTTISMAFDALWYAYLQAEGYLYPVSVAVAESIGEFVPGSAGAPRHLDFGSGVGVTSQLFERLGYKVDLADISTSLMTFAKFRLQRRSVEAQYIDLNVEEPATGAYEVITALATLVHVPDLAATARLLHRSLRPGGLLFANFDVRPPSPENAPHLYSDDRPLRWLLHRTGFEPIEDLDGMVTMYRRVDPAGLRHQLRGMRDWVGFRTPLRPAVRRARKFVQRSAKRSFAIGARNA